MANTKITNPELFNLGANNTAATQLPVMTTTQRIAMTGLSDGEMIFNSDTDKVEYWDGTKWYGITYETDGFSVNYLIVAGGGGGGSAYGASGAGGGAGEYLTNVGGTSIVLETAITYTVIVGGGGAKGILGQNMSNGSSVNLYLPHTLQGVVVVETMSTELLLIQEGLVEVQQLVIQAGKQEELLLQWLQE
jgi:hypothetical protein